MKHKIEVEDIESNVYYKMNSSAFVEILDIVNSKPRACTYIKFHRKDLDEFVKQSTVFLDAMYADVRYSSRLHCIFHNIASIPKCQTCHESYVNMQHMRIDSKTPRFCSSSCQMRSEETQKCMRSTMLQKYGVEYALQDKQTLERATQRRHDTNLKKYGVEEVLSLKSVQEKKEATNLHRYGVKCTLQTAESKDKICKTCIEKYGVDHHMKNKAMYAKSRQTCKQKYGDEHPIRTQSVKDKLNATNRRLYGVDWTFQSENNKQKTKKTCQEKYGTDYALQAHDVKQHAKQTLLETYGVEHNSQIPSVRSQMKKKYDYNSIQFDSSAELCLYIWLVDNNIKFIFQPETHFEYKFGGKTHCYCPDFQIGDIFIEVKGDHFFKDCNPRNEMICPFDHTQDALYEAKHQCMLKNNVVVMTSCDYAIFQTYVELTYGKQHWKKFKKAA